MHMAAAGSYAGILMGSKVFYVIQPPGDGRPMPNRDVIEFPQLLGLGTIMHQPIEIISLLRDGSGLIKDLAEIIPESLFWRFCEMKGNAQFSERHVPKPAVPSFPEIIFFVGQESPAGCLGT